MVIALADLELTEQRDFGTMALVHLAPAGDAQPARHEEAVPMTLIRRRIAERLVHAQQDAALLTTFNEIDMSAVKAMRARHQEAFTERHGVKLGFMSFFTKAVIEALRLIPNLNSEIRGQDIVSRDYYDIGIAIGSGKGLVVPVIGDLMVQSSMYQFTSNMALLLKSGVPMLEALAGIPVAQAARRLA